MQKEENDLRDRTKEFALRVVRMFAKLPRSFEAQHLGKQVLRSGTSVGANYREAHRARSFSLSASTGERVEVRCRFAFGGIVPATKLSALRQECDELTAIFVTILKRAKGEI